MEYFTWLGIFAFFLLFLDYGYRWISVSKFLNTRSDQEKFLNKTECNGVSVIIPFRNEAYRIQGLLDSIIHSNAEGYQFEILLVDDHSTDNTSEIILSQLGRAKIKWKLLQLDEKNIGKKNAILWGIKNSRFDAIHTIDADCQFSSNFLIESQINYYQSNKNLLVLPVHFFGGKNLVSAYQIMENTALVALGLFQLKNNKPSMANGANLMFNKELFLNLDPYKTNRSILGGDDIFTLEAFYNFNSTKVGYSIHPNLSVSTPILPNLNELTNQRLRWIQKTNKQQFNYTANSQIFLAAFLTSFWVILAATAYTGHELYFFIALFFKIALDFWIQPKILSHFNSKVQPIYLLLSSVFQIFYIPTLGLLSMLKKPDWKNRKAI